MIFETFSLSDGGLYNLRQAIGRIDQFTEGVTFPHYQGNDMLRAAVKRQFEIIGNP